MTKVLRTAILAGAFIALASPARSLTIVTLTLDAAASSIAPSVGPAQSLSGTLTLRVGTLPLGSTSVAFDVIDLAITASGGATIGLDPGIANPGLGILSPAGTFLVPTLFVRITDVGSTDLAIPDVEGGVVFGPGGASIDGLTVSFAIATASGLVDVSLVAVPEPATAALLALGLAALATARPRVGGSR